MKYQNQHCLIDQWTNGYVTWPPSFLDIQRGCCPSMLKDRIVIISYFFFFFLLIQYFHFYPTITFKNQKADAEF